MKLLRLISPRRGRRAAGVAPPVGRTIRGPVVIETLAEWYLKRRGRVVLPRAFVGVAFGFCRVYRDDERNAFTVLPMWSPGFGAVIALNNTTIIPESKP